MHHIHTLRCTHTHTRAGAGHTHTAGVPLKLQQPSKAPIGAMDGAPRLVERCVLERSPVIIITYRLACSACYHQLLRGDQRKC